MMLLRRNWHPSVTDAVILEACQRRLCTLDNPGFCVACGAEAMGVEPDAEDYQCESCGRHQVCGCEALLMVIGIG